MSLQRAMGMWRDRRLVKKYGQAATNANTVSNYAAKNGQATLGQSAAAGPAMGTKLGRKTETLLNKPKKLAKVNKAMYGKPAKPSAPKEPESLF